MTKTNSIQRLYTDTYSESQFQEFTSYLASKGFHKTSDCYWTVIYSDGNKEYIISREF